MQAINTFEAGAKVEGFFLVKSSLLKTSSNKKNYLDLMLSDNTGSINAKLWDCVPGDETAYPASSMVKVRGVVSLWQQQLQLKIDKIRISTPEDNVDINNLIESAPISPAQMFEELTQYLDGMQNDHIKSITALIIEQNKESFISYPAAKKNHHAVRSGLLYHTLSMLRAAKGLCSVYTFLNTDLLYAGVMLHDIAKVCEMDANHLGVVDDYTEQGYLLGHIIQGIIMVDRAVSELGSDPTIGDMLKHMILAHHYEPEFGSPKKPMFAEAEMLHYLDIIDSKMYDIKKTTENMGEKKISERVWTLDRKLYKVPQI